jgi:hypothetical protein
MWTWFIIVSFFLCNETDPYFLHKIGQNRRKMQQVLAHRTINPHLVATVSPMGSIVWRLWQKKIKKLEYFFIIQALCLISRAADSEAKIGQESFETGEDFF